MSKEKKTYKVYLVKGRGVLIKGEHTEGLVVTEDRFFANSLVYSRKIGSFEPFPNQNPDGSYNPDPKKEAQEEVDPDEKDPDKTGSSTGQGKKGGKEPK